MPRYVALFRGINVGKAKRVAMADLCAALMTEVLGYPRFCSQGGDIGAAVTARLAAARVGGCGVHRP